MEDPGGPREFATTQWSLVAAARPTEDDRTRAREALAELCRRYWYPLYAFVRFRGYSPDDARDLTQSFFARIIETDGFASADREKGRFRSYLLGAMKHFLANEWHRSRAQKRGGGARFVEWAEVDAESRFARGAGGDEGPEAAFDREWALETVGGALRALGEEMERSGKGEQFAALRGTLTGEDDGARAELAMRLGMSEGAVKVAVHRLRARYRALLRAAVAETVSGGADLEDEMRYLVAVLRRC